MSVYPARITLIRKIASLLPASYKHYCSELLRKARFPPKDPTVGPVECRMVISPRFALPRSVIPTP